VVDVQVHHDVGLAHVVDRGEGIGHRVDRVRLVPVHRLQPDRHPVVGRGAGEAAQARDHVVAAAGVEWAVVLGEGRVDGAAEVVAPDAGHHGQRVRELRLTAGHHLRVGRGDVGVEVEPQ